MTSDEIKKALECCSSPCNECAKCPYFEIHLCIVKLKKDAVAYINELESKRKHQQAKIIKEKNKNSKLRNKLNRFKS